MRPTPNRIAFALALTVLCAACQSSGAGSTAVKATTVDLTPVPAGTATVTVSADGLGVSATLDLTGFTIRARYAVTLQAGTCAAPGAAITSFPDLTVDAFGAMRSTVNSPAPPRIPASAILEITPAAAAQTASGTGTSPVACVDIPNTRQSVAQRVLGFPGTSPSATVTLTYHPPHTLDVHITAHGLQPGSGHAVHVHFGSCARQSGVLYALGDVTADASGDVAATTSLTVGSPPPVRGWYADVHNAPTAGLIQAGMPTAGFEPVLCGDGHF